MLRRILMIDSPRATASFSSRRSMCRASRRAVFLPIPGSFDSSLTAFSSKEELNDEIMAQSYKILFMTKHPYRQNYLLIADAD